MGLVGALGLLSGELSDSVALSGLREAGVDVDLNRSDASVDVQRREHPCFWQWRACVVQGPP